MSDAEDELDGVLDGREGEEYHSQPIQVSNLQEYFVTAFKMLGQLGCKDIGKAWIKMGHPKKQSTHPYNGGNTKEESYRRFGFEGALKTPIYWPPWEGWQDGKGCRHREPDHIKKPGPSAFGRGMNPADFIRERLILLNHLLHCGHHRFTIEKLEMGTAQIEREIPKNFTAKSIKILRQIYYARRMEIRYEQKELGELRHCPKQFACSCLSGADTVINLYMPKPTAKAPKVPKAITVTPIKDEPSQRVADSKHSAKAPTADMGLEAAIEGDPVPTQMDTDSIEETKPTLSSVPSECLSLQHKQEAAQYNGDGLPKTESPSFVSVQRQRHFPSSIPQEEGPWHTTTDQFGGLPVEYSPRSSRKRGLLAHTRPSSFKPVLMSRGQRAPVPYQGGISSRYSPTESQLRNGILSPSEHREMSVAHNTGQQPRTLSNAPAYPLSSTRRLVAPKPMSFSGSSSGFAGLPSDYLWQASSDHSNARQLGSSGPIYTDGADPNALLTPYPSDVTSSFGSDDSDSTLGGGLQMNNLSGLSGPQVQADRQALDAEFRQYYPTYLTSNFSALSVEPGPSDHAPLFPFDYSTGVECRFTPYSQEPRYL